MKKIVSFLLVMVLVVGITSAGFAATTISSNTTARADALKAMGLFAGTSNGYDLEILPTRTQAIVFLIRMLGEENEALNSTYTCPFTDVDSWALPYIAYAYNKGYTNGLSATTFGANNLTTLAQFFTFMLKALGYSSTEDFVWSASVQKAESLGIIPTGKYTANMTFNRGICVDIMYGVLAEKMKGSDSTLATTLISNGTIDETLAKANGFDNNGAGLIDPSTDTVSEDTTTEDTTNQTQVTGTFVVPKYQDTAACSLSSYSDGYFVVGYGYSEELSKNVTIIYDQSMKPVGYTSEYKYYESGFHDGLMKVKTRIPDVSDLYAASIAAAKRRSLLFLQQGKHGYLDPTGKLIIPCDYYGSSDFKNGMAVVYTFDGTNVTTLVINKQNQVLLKPGRSRPYKLPVRWKNSDQM